MPPCAISRAPASYFSVSGRLRKGILIGNVQYFSIATREGPNGMVVDMSELSVLVVDDNSHMRSLFRAILSGFGVRRVFEAADGADALAVAVDRKPDIAICDWLMTPISGAEFLTLLRHDRGNMISEIPVIMVSADARRQVILRAAQLGIDEFLAKPVSPAMLYQRMLRILNNPPKRRRKGGERRATSALAGVARRGSGAQAEVCYL
ncbi:response regulator [Stappia sp. ICDLI1TA098]